MSEIPMFRYDPELTPIDNVDWTKISAVSIGGKTYPVEHVETKRDEIRFRLPGAHDVVEVVA